ncbi:toll/interleukin-1 receptor domain-containing protein [Streptomyces microflavus]|uniref:toll/interleukin-1 receptor domain-containing protein n=1 Tax=Streptomyces microflavus TaxID=1919 RepID=UPI0035DA4E95
MREVFISHSARGDTFAEDVLEAVRTGLKAKGYVPLVDSDIEAGHKWYGTLTEWMSKCGAAVMLLNESAFKSNWVQREVHILMARHQVRPFPVLPVLMGDACSDDFKKYNMGELSTLQCLGIPSDTKPHAGDLARQVVDQFADISAVVEAEDSGDPMKRLLDRIASYMPTDPRHAELVERAERELSREVPQSLSGETSPPFTTLHGAHLSLAGKFLGADPERVYKAVCEIAPVLEGNLRDLCLELSVLWVDDNAARGLLPEPGTAPRELTILLNAGRKDTVRQYMHRAICGDLNAYSLVRDGYMPTGEDAAAEMKVDLVASMWRDCLNLEPPSGPSDRPVYEESTFYVVINELCPPGRVLTDTVRLLHSDHPWLILVLTTGSALLEGEAMRKFNNAAVLTPQLTSDQEDRAHTQNARLQTIHQRIKAAVLSS